MGMSVLLLFKITKLSCFIKGFSLLWSFTFFSSRFQRYVEWAKSRMKEQGLDDCTVNTFLLNYIEPFNLEGKDEQASESQNEETRAMETAEPKLAATSDESNGNQAALLEGDPHCDPLGKCGSNELDRTGFQAVTKTHSPKSPSGLHDDSKQDDGVEQESLVLSSEEYRLQEFVLVQEESDWSPEEENACEKSHVRLQVSCTLFPIIL